MTAVQGGTVVRRLAVLALAAAAAACGSTVEPPAGPLDGVYKPTGMAVQRFGTAPGATRLWVASSNGDLRYDDPTGGSVIGFEGDPTAGVRIAGALNVDSFAGDLALADPAVCATAFQVAGARLEGPRAITATRGSNLLHVLGIDGAGGLSCVDCDVALSGPFADPLPVAVACSPSRARAFVGYIGTRLGEGWVSEYDLVHHALRSFDPGPGSVRSFTYDAHGDRLYLLGLATSVPTPLRWIDLAGCDPSIPEVQGGCGVRSAALPTRFGGLELRSMALAPPQAGRPRRAYLTARLYDLALAQAFGFRTVDLGGKLLAVDLVEDARGGLTLDVVNDLDLGSGAQEVRVLPRGPSWPATRRDLVAVLTVDEGWLRIYDDETGAVASFGRDAVTGLQLVGQLPYGLAVDPAPVGSVARLWVGSYANSFVTPFDVPLDPLPDVEAAGFAGGVPRRIGVLP